MDRFDPIQSPGETFHYWQWDASSGHQEHLAGTDSETARVAVHRPIEAPITTRRRNSKAGKAI